MLLTFAARDRRDTRPVELHVLTPRLAVAGAGRPGARGARARGARCTSRASCRFATRGHQGRALLHHPPVETPSLARPPRARPPAPGGRGVRIAGDLLDAWSTPTAAMCGTAISAPSTCCSGPRRSLVASFGLVEALDVAASRGTAGSTAVTIGAPAYLSPEQLAGETTADERSDLYSFGCVAFELLAAEPPFGGSQPRLGVEPQAHPDGARGPVAPRERAADARSSCSPAVSPASRRPLPERPRGARGAAGPR